MDQALFGRKVDWEGRILILDAIFRFYRWYDGHTDFKKILILLLISSPIWSVAFWATNWIAISVAGSYFLFLILTRHWYLKGKRRKKLDTNGNIFWICSCGATNSVHVTKCGMCEAQVDPSQIQNKEEEIHSAFRDALEDLAGRDQDVLNRKLELNEQSAKEEENKKRAEARAEARLRRRQRSSRRRGQ